MGLTPTNLNYSNVYNKNNQCKNTTFTGKIIAPDNFRDELLSSCTTIKDRVKIVKALKAIRDTHPDELLRFERDKEGGLHEYVYRYRAYNVSKGETIAVEKISGKGGWVKFFLKVADLFTNKYDEISGLIKDVKVK
ncbi:MAG: hypothetical protein WCY19_03235 [Candidatus Gastranaerophilaceae bacterium]